MADSSRTIMTDAGFALETRVRADETKMQFTRATISTDDHFSDTDDALAKLTELYNIQQDGKVTAVQVINTTTVYVQVDVNQAESKADYQMRSAALYAKDDDGTEVLYGVTVLQDPVFVHKDADGSYLGFGINTTVGKASNVVVVVDPANMVTQQVFEGTMKNYYTKAEVDAKFVTDDDFASKLPKNIATTDAANTFAKSQTLAGGATDGKGNAYATTKDVATGLNNGLSTKVTDNKNGSIQINGNTITPADDSKVSTLQMQVDNSAVGTNLLINTETETGAMWLTQGNNLSGEKLNGCNVETQTGDWKSARYLFDDLKERNVINTTDDFIFSAMLRVDPTLKDSPATINFFSTATDKDNTMIGYIKDYADGYWHKVSIVFKFLTTPTNATAFTQSIRFELGATNGATVYWTQRKLEKGSKATDWCPNPEDKVNVTDMRKPASDVAGIEEVNAKQDKIGYTPADDSKVAHLSGANNFDTVPTVNNNPLLLASSLPSDLARTGSDQEFTGKNTFDTAPIDKKTGNPYITRDGVPAVPPTLADTTKDANFTGKLQKSGIDVATKSDVTTAVSTATANMVDSTKATNFTAGLQSGGVDVATAADLKSIEASAWRQLGTEYIITGDNIPLNNGSTFLYKIDKSTNRIYLFFILSMESTKEIKISLKSIAKNIGNPSLKGFENICYMGAQDVGDMPIVSNELLLSGSFIYASAYAYYAQGNTAVYYPCFVTYDELV